MSCDDLKEMKRRGASLLILFMSFSCTTSFLTGIARHTKSISSSCSSLASTVPSPSLDSFNPIGPPSILSELLVGEAFSITDSTINRLSKSPDIFLIKAFLSQNDRDVLMQAASNQGLKMAGTRNSEINTIRKNSYLTWIDPHNISGEHDAEALKIAKEMVFKSGAYCVHEALHKVIAEGGKVDYFFAEDVQVAKYDADGRFGYHHDGYSRYLTVLVYLNGIGGTYFPFANLGFDVHAIDNAVEESAVEIARKSKDVGKDGILIVGKEGAGPYITSGHDAPLKSVFEIEAGDAVAFYSYKPSGDKEWRALHCSLPVPEEKWIATCWFRSEALTGPFSYLKKEALLESVQ
jgi:hypothetical protein